MKTLLLADCHTKDPSKLISSLLQEKRIGKIALLGDIEMPEILRKTISLAAQNEISFIYTPGNHEYHYVHREKGLYDRVTLEHYAKIWDESPEEKKVVIDASKISESKKGLIVSDNEIVYAHASIIDAPSVQNPHVSDIMWGRVGANNDLARLTFKTMRDLDDFRLFFRGHDHASAVYLYNGARVKKLDDFTGKISLNFDKEIAIATVGAFCQGRYALYDDEIKEIDFIRGENI